MTRISTATVAAMVWTLVSGGVGSAGARAGAPGPGVVVADVGKGSAAEKAGIERGDVLLTWKRVPAAPGNPRSAEGRFETPFDVEEIEIEEAPRGKTTIEVERTAERATRKGGRRSSVTIPAGSWELDVRPNWDGADLDDWREGKILFAAGDGVEGLGRWEHLAARLATSAKGAALPMADGSTGRAAPPDSRNRLALWLRLRIAEALSAAGEKGAAHAEAMRAIDEAGRLGDGMVAARGWAAEGRRFANENRPPAARGAFQCAVEAREIRSAESLAVAANLDALGTVSVRAGDVDGAEGDFRRALAIREARAPGSLAVAASFSSLGNLALVRGELEAAMDFHRRALAIRERLVPDGVAVAASLSNLGNVANNGGDLDAAEEYYGRALVLRRKLVPDSLDEANLLNNLGVVTLNRGDLASAEAYLRRSLAIKERVAPDGIEVASSLNNLGNVALRRGDLGAGEALHRRALAIRERLAPGGLDVSASLINLGSIVLSRGDLDSAESFDRRALALSETLAPDGLDVALILNNLGIVEIGRGDFESAGRLFRRALSIRERLVPDTLDVAETLANLGAVARSRDDLESAENFYLRDLELTRKLAPGSLGLAESLQNLAGLAIDRGDPAGSVHLLAEAHGIEHRLAPGTAEEAETLHLSAVADLRLGLVGGALDLYCESLRSLEAQQGKLGGTEEAKAGFSAKYADWYREYAELLVRHGRAVDAFHVLERFRAKGLLALLAERDLVLSSEIPEELGHERMLAAADHDRMQAMLAQLAATDGADIEPVEAEMREIRRRQDEVREKIRAASPKLASLVYPEPLDLAAARQLLDPGTLLLVFSTGEKSGRLFVVGRGESDFEVVGLPLSRRELERGVAKFRREIRAAAEAGDPRREEAVRRSAASLATSLLAPVAAKIAAASRLLIVPDGPLHFLPFSALADPTSASFRWLVEAKPVHSVVSMTVYRELVAQRRATEELPDGLSAAPGRIVAFGDPVYPEGASGRLRGGANLDPLPATRTEIENIRALAPTSTETHLGAEATEARAKRLGGRVDAVHFACHGILDERFPLDSALALTMPERAPDALSGNREDNGLLEAWEIFEKVRIDADLVTLSACETAIGKEMGGEGLVGLVRAFEYAGARSVLASLWSASDESTAVLMASFYRRWRQGAPKDEALRQAQIELLKTKWSSPFHWAAFEMIGDWR